MHYMWSANLLKSFEKLLSILCVNIYFSQSVVNYIFSIVFSTD